MTEKPFLFAFTSVPPTTQLFLPSDRHKERPTRPRRRSPGGREIFRRAKKNRRGVRARSAPHKRKHHNTYANDAAAAAVADASAAYVRRYSGRAVHPFTPTGNWLCARFRVRISALGAVAHRTIVSTSTEP